MRGRWSMGTRPDSDARPACDDCTTRPPAIQHHGPRDSIGRCGLRISGRTTLTGPIPPEDERILHRLPVVGGPHAGKGEAEPLVEPAGRIVRPPDLQRRAGGALDGGLLQDERQQRAGDAAPAPRRVDGEVVDVQLVEDDPAGAVGDDGAAAALRPRSGRRRSAPRRSWSTPIRTSPGSTAVRTSPRRRRGSRPGRGSARHGRDRAAAPRTSRCRPHAVGRTAARSRASSASGRRT